MLQRRTGHAMAEDERFAVDVLAALFSRRSLVRLPPSRYAYACPCADRKSFI